MKHLLFINFKTYPQATGKNALKLARILNKLKSPYKIVVCPQYTDIKDIKKNTQLPIYSQHCDPIIPGAHTGSILPEALKQAGCDGTLLNHSEKPLKLKTIKETIVLCKKQKLKTIVFAGNLSMMKKILKFSPDYIAYEPKKLVGGNISVTKSNPKIILKAVQLIQRINPKVKFLVGAGIHSKRCIQTAILLGAHGAGMAHAVVKGTEKQIKRILC